MNVAFEKMKILVGMKVDEESSPDAEDSSFLEGFNRNCTLSTKQVLFCYFIFFLNLGFS